MFAKRAIIAAIASGFALSAQASSHREAPFIAQHPAVDGTDFYMFVSYATGRSGYVTFLANYNPLQDSYGGPNYFALDPNAIYEINVDNNGDGVEDLTFQFTFTNTFTGATVNTGTSSAPLNLAIPLINLPPDSNGNPTLDRVETYSLNIIKGGARTGTPQAASNSAGTTFTKPVDNIGFKSIPNYQTYASQYIYPVTIPGCSTQGTVFAGQRAEGFFANLGEIFDLVNLNPLGPTSGSPNVLKNANITTLAIEVPIACLTADGATASATKSPVIGAWTTSSLRQSHIVNPVPAGPTTTSAGKGPEVVGGAWTQVSRLGAPLVNELVIGITDKDKFNSSQPKNDSQFANYVTNPTLPVLLNALFGTAANVPPVPRNDLVEAFLTGVPGVNQPANVVASEELRLNVALPPTPIGSQNSLGALQCFTNAGALDTSNPGCDPAGFPNGRRPGDDVVDIELRVAEGALLGAADPNALPDGSHPAYTDGVSGNSSQYGATFPYLNSPLPGSPNGPNGFPPDGSGT